jgi:hypothetical protein
VPLHIFLCVEVLLYFIVCVEVVEIQIWFELKLVCNLQKGMKIHKGFSIFLRRIALNPSLGPTASSRAWTARPSWPAPVA